MTREAQNESGLDDAVLARIEDAGINASAPPEQRWVDGWLVRYSAGKAKRARCIQAVAAGRLPVADKLAICLPIYERHGLWPYVRITPFSQPDGLDAELAGRGMERIDDTRVMVMPLRAPHRESRAEVASGRAIGAAAHHEFAAWVGAARGSSATEIDAHAARLAHAPVPHRAMLCTDRGGAVVAGGLSVIEGDVVGLYDVFTAEAHRGRGHAEAVCRALLEHAKEQGVRTAYLQVDAANEAARRIYRRLGFADAYRYHYRTPPAAGGSQAPRR